MSTNPDILVKISLVLVSKWPLKIKKKTAAEYISLHDRQAGQNKHVHMYKIYLWKYLQLKISTNITLHKLHNKA